MIEILDVNISKNPVAANEKFIVSVSVRPYFTARIELNAAAPTLISSFIKAKPAGYAPGHQEVKLQVGVPAVEIVKIKN